MQSGPEPGDLCPACQPGITTLRAGSSITQFRGKAQGSRPTAGYRPGTQLLGRIDNCYPQMTEETNQSQGEMRI